MKRPISSLEGEDEDSSLALVRQEILWHVIQATALPSTMPRASLVEDASKLLHEFLVQRGRAPLDNSNGGDKGEFLVILVGAMTDEFTQNLIALPDHGRVAKNTRQKLEDTARRFLIDEESVSGAWALALLLASLSVGHEPSHAAARSVASAMASVIEQKSIFAKVPPAMVPSMVESLLQKGMELQLDRQPVHLDLHVVGAWARSFRADSSHYAPLSNTTANLIRHLLLLDKNDGNDDDASLNSDAEERARKKVRLAGALTLATQIAPWDDLSPLLLIEEAIPSDLWYGAERICESLIGWQENRPSASSARKSVQRLIDLAMEGKQYRRADTFATKFFAYGGDEQYLDARFYHACDTISRLIQKHAFPIIERQVERVDNAMQEAPPVEGSGVDRSADIRAFTFIQLGEHGHMDVAKRLSDLWKMDHAFDEEALVEMAKAKKRKYLQWEDALPEHDVPEVLSTPEQLMKSFLNANFCDETVERVYGFDVEWGDDSKGAALLQIATTEKVALVDIPALSMTQNGTDALELTVGKLFESPNTLIVGFSCRQDMARLQSSPCARSRHWLGKTQGVVDVQKMIEKEGVPSLRGLGLSKACEHFLGKPLDKSEQCSFWSARPLTKEQRVYAALDAWTCAVLYERVHDATCAATNDDTPLSRVTSNTSVSGHRSSSLAARSGSFLGLCMVLVCLVLFPGIQAFSTHGIPRNKLERYSTLPRFESTSSSQERTKADASKTTPEKPPETKRTLYDVLQAHPGMTRTELKKQYVKLARKSHPDALRQNQDKVESDLDFTEIAAAWEILSDAKQRKRYDRSLQAEEFSRQVESWAGQALEQAVPVAQAFGRVAVPFLRKTAAGTVAGVAAAANAYSKAAQAEEARAMSIKTTADAVEEKNEVASPGVAQGKERKGLFGKYAETTNTTDTEIQSNNPSQSSPTTHAKSRRDYGNNLDGSSLVEKSQGLEKRAAQQSQEASAVKEQLEQVRERRLRLALHTPHSGLTSSEASILLEDLNQTVADRLSPLDRAMLRHTVLEEIESLTRIEGSFVSAQKADTQAQDVYRDAVQERVKNVEALSQAIEEEDAARRAWVAAQERVQNSRKDLVDTTRALAQAEIQAKKSDYELELQQMQLDKQAEKVRKALVQKETQARQAKEQELLTQQDLQESRSDDASRTLLDETWYYPDDDSPERIAELRELKDEEERLLEDLFRLDAMAARLMSRSGKLQQKAQDLERQQ